MPHLDWDDLRIFLEAARSRSVTRAAKALALDHSTVSRRLTRLEFAVGSSLFERTRDGLSLTQAGLVVLRRAEELAGSIGGLTTDLTGGAEASGTVRLATMEGIASLYIAPRLGALHRRRPDLRVELVTSPQMVRVTRREADLFLSFFRPSGRGLVSERIGAFKTGLYGSPDLLAARGPPQTVQDLRGAPFVGYIEDLVQVDAVRWLEELVPEPNLVFTSNSMIAQMTAARGGLGLVVLPSFAIDDHTGLVPLLPDLRGQRDLWMSTHPDMAGLPRVRAVKTFLRDMVAADPAFSPASRDPQK